MAEFLSADEAEVVDAEVSAGCAGLVVVAAKTTTANDSALAERTRADAEPGAMRKERRDGDR